jgi:outer membrane protein TolC
VPPPAPAGPSGSPAARSYAADQAAAQAAAANARSTGQTPASGAAPAAPSANGAASGATVSGTPYGATVSGTASGAAVSGAPPAAAGTTSTTTPAGAATTTTPSATSATSTPSTTPSGALAFSRGQAITEALAHNQGILAAAEQVEEARAAVVTAAAFVDPTIAYGETLGNNQELQISGTLSDVSLTFTVPFPGKRGLRRRVAEASLHAAEQTLVQTRQQVASQAAQDYDALLVALRHRVDLKESRDFSQDFLTKTQARFTAGTAAKVDVVKAKVDLAQADDDLIANERTTDSARATLNRVIGRSGGSPLAVTEELAVPAALPDVAVLERIAYDARPELRSNLAQRKGASDATRLARQFWLPDLNFTVGRNALYGGSSAYSAQLLVGFPIFFWQHEKGEVANAEHRESELTADYNDLFAQVSLDVRSAYATESTALRQVVFLRDELLPEAREVYRVAAISYGLGASSALDFLDAKRTLVDAERQYVDALGAVNDAQAALEQAMGAPIPAAGAAPAAPAAAPGDHR